MQIDALFFAAYRDQVGESRRTVVLPDGSRARDLVVALRSRGRPFDRLPESPSVAVNEVWADLDAVLDDGDVVAFIPPVAGG